MKLFFLFVAAAEEFSLIFLLGAWYDSNLTRSLVFFFSLHEPHASFSWDVILVPILGLFLFSFFVFIVGHNQDYVPGGYTWNNFVELHLVWRNHWLRRYSPFSHMSKSSRLILHNLLMTL